VQTVDELFGVPLMDNVTSFRGKEDLTARQPVTIKLPRFLIRAFEQQVAEANVDATNEDRVTLEHFIELHLAEQLSIADVANLERDVSGISQAVWQWLSEINGE
jgi:hypothetical protein